MQAKINAEQTFYRDIQATADKAAGRQAWVDHKLAQRTAVIELADQTIVRDKGAQVTLLQSFLREQNRLAGNRQEELTLRREELDGNYRASFDTLALKTQQLAVVRAKLLNISRDRDHKALLISALRHATCLASVQTDIKVQDDEKSIVGEQVEIDSNGDEGECK